MNLESMKILGLTDGEIKVYSTILDKGSCAVNSIHEKTGLERRSIYDILNKLLEKGLIAYTLEDGKKTYRCSPPKAIEEHIVRRKQLLTDLEHQLPAITETYTSKKPQTTVQVFRGKKGIFNVYEDTLTEKECIFIAGGYGRGIFGAKWTNFNKRRIEKKIKWHNLCLEELREANKGIDKTYYKIQYLPKEYKEIPATIAIYGNKVVNFLYDEMIAIVIENKGAADNYRKYFNYLSKHVAKE